MNVLYGQPLMLVDDAGDVDYSRWLHLFGVTWSRLPWRVTQDIGAYWRGKAPELIITKNLRSPLSPGKACGGFVDPCGLRIFLDVDVLGPLTDKLVMTVVAHELAHVWNFALARLGRCPEGQWSEKKCDKIGKGWGFPMDALRGPQAARTGR